jgi:hypothetical protein
MARFTVILPPAANYLDYRVSFFLDDDDHVGGVRLSL